jgi:hypothetical protein
MEETGQLHALTALTAGKDPRHTSDARLGDTQELEKSPPLLEIELLSSSP